MSKLLLETRDPILRDGFATAPTKPRAMRTVDCSMLLGGSKKLRSSELSATAMSGSPLFKLPRADIASDRTLLATPSEPIAGNGATAHQLDSDYIISLRSDILRAVGIRNDARKNAGLPRNKFSKQSTHSFHHLAGIILKDEGGTTHNTPFSVSITDEHLTICSSDALYLELPMGDITESAVQEIKSHLGEPTKNAMPFIANAIRRQSQTMMTLERIASARSELTERLEKPVRHTSDESYLRSQQEMSALTAELVGLSTELGTEINRRYMEESAPQEIAVSLMKAFATCGDAYRISGDRERAILMYEASISWTEELNSLSISRSKIDAVHNSRLDAIGDELENGTQLKVASHPGIKLSPAELREVLTTLANVEEHLGSGKKMRSGRPIDISIEAKSQWLLGRSYLLAIAARDARIMDISEVDPESRKIVSLRRIQILELIAALEALTKSVRLADDFKLELPADIESNLGIVSTKLIASLEERIQETSPSHPQFKKLLEQLAEAGMSQGRAFLNSDPDRAISGYLLAANTLKQLGDDEKKLETLEMIRKIGKRASIHSETIQEVARRATVLRTKLLFRRFISLMDEVCGRSEGKSDGGRTVHAILTPSMTGLSRPVDATIREIPGGIVTIDIDWAIHTFIQGDLVDDITAATIGDPNSKSHPILARLIDMIEDGFSKKKESMEVSTSTPEISATMRRRKEFISSSFNAIVELLGDLHPTRVLANGTEVFTGAAIIKDERTPIALSLVRDGKSIFITLHGYNNTTIELNESMNDTKIRRLITEQRINGIDLLPEILKALEHRQNNTTEEDTREIKRILAHEIEPFLGLTLANQHRPEMIEISLPKI